jgi:hypothetical protein
MRTGMRWARRTQVKTGLTLASPYPLGCGICRVPEREFDFLGYTFGRMYSPVTGKARLGYRPSKKSIKRMVEKLHADAEQVDLGEPHPGTPAAK